MLNRIVVMLALFALLFVTMSYGDHEGNWFTNAASDTGDWFKGAGESIGDFFSDLFGDSDD